MKLVSVNTGLPRDVTWHGRIVTTGIFKQAVQGRVALRKLNLDGDRQADLTVHGGEHKSVYCYPMEHYGYWRRELPGRELPMGISEKTSQPTAYWKVQSILGTGSLSVLRQ